MRAEWGVPGEWMVLPERCVPYLFRAQELVCCRRIKALDDEPNAQRKLKYKDRKCGQQCQRGLSPDDTEHHGQETKNEYGCSNDTDQGKGSGHQARLVQQEAQ